jgi:hypothetical protein
MDQLFRPQILVFLPEKAGTFISARLTEVGYFTSVAGSIPDLRAALDAVDYDLVITMRPDINTVRGIKPLPVINLEIFFHPDPQRTPPDIGTEQFDCKAFLDRVKALTEPGRARVKHSASEVAASPAGSGYWLWRRFRFWLKLAGSRGFPVSQPKQLLFHSTHIPVRGE